MLVTPSFVFIDVPKCGCTSVFEALGQMPDGNWHEREIPDGFEALPRVAVVRNPYGRALSMYYFELHQCRIGNKSWYPGGAEAFYRRWRLDALDSFVEECIVNRDSREFPNFLPCHLFLAPVQPVVTLHLEDLQAEWDCVDYLPCVEIPHRRQQIYPAELSARQHDLIRAWAFEDFEAFGYEEN